MVSTDKTLIVTPTLSEAELEIVKSKTISFFKDLGFEVDPIVNPNSPFFSPKLSVAEEAGLSVRVEGEALGILIGFRGETLSSLQTILSLLINKELSNKRGERVKVFVNLDVGGWRREREETLIDLVQKAIDKSIQTSSPVGLPPMSGSERRIVHLYASTLSGVEEWSEGEEPNRRIVVKAS